MARKFAEYQQAFKQLGYSFRVNVMNDVIECNGERLTDITEAKVKSQMADAGFSVRSHVIEAWQRVAGIHPYHPLKEYFDGLVWHGQDIFGMLISHFEFQEPEASRKFLWRFLLGAVAKVYNQHRNVMLVIDGKQMIGKSYFVRWLCPPVLRDFFVEGPLNPEIKDTQLRIISSFLWEVGEFQSTTRKADQEALKNIISQQRVTVRRPYGRNDFEKPILTSFVGTINENGTGWHTDTTGSTRFVTVKMNAIDHAYTRLDVDQLWAQIYAVYQNGESADLTDVEAMEQARINQEYEVASPAVQLLYKHYDIDADQFADDWVSIADILVHLEDNGLKQPQKLSQMDISATLQKHGCERSNSAPITGHGRQTCYSGIREKTTIFKKA